MWGPTSSAIVALETSPVSSMTPVFMRSMMTPCIMVSSRNFSRCFSLDNDNNFLLSNSNNFFLNNSSSINIFFNSLFLLSLMELSHMGYHLSFCHLLQVVGFLIMNGGKFEKTLDEGVSVIISGKADASIIKVILPSGL